MNPEPQTNAGRTFFETTFPSTFDAMSDVLDDTLAALRKARWIDKDAEPKTRLCLEEAFANAIRHGNQCDEKRNVHLTLSDCGNLCKIEVLDEGHGFSPDHVCKPDREQVGGRGVVLMKHYMERVEFDKNECCLRLWLRRRFAKP